MGGVVDVVLLCLAHCYHCCRGLACGWLAGVPQAERLFVKALKLEPRNAELLGAFAEHLVSKAGREGEAGRLFQRAVEADADNRENLEGYASFLR